MWVRRSGKGQVGKLPATGLVSLVRGAAAGAWEVDGVMVGSRGVGFRWDIVCVPH